MSQAPVILVLADESADWMIAGLRQLDRIALAVNEHAGNSGIPIAMIVRWDETIPKADRWLPAGQGMSAIQITEWNHSAAPASLFSTHLLIPRREAEELIHSAPIVSTADDWNDLAARAASWAANNSGLLYVSEQTDIPKVEKRFLRRAGKSQDGPVSRFLNRKLSRAVTRLLLKVNVSPTQWTISLMILPVLAAFFLGHGDYWNVLLGAGLFQLFSMLDGCDGEIARAKYLESSSGERIDFLSDLAGSLLFVVALGFGLSHRALNDGTFYAGEGIVCAILITANELGLRLSAWHRDSLGKAASSGTLYARHQAMIEHSGLGFLGERFVSVLVQFTKRDVAIFFFFLLAAANLPQYILHLWTGVTGVNLLFTAVAAWNVRTRGHARVS